MEALIAFASTIGIICAIEGVLRLRAICAKRDRIFRRK